MTEDSVFEECLNFFAFMVVDGECIIVLKNC